MTKAFIQVKPLSNDDREDLYDINTLVKPIIVIEDIFVPAKQRRKGVATKMINKLIASHNGSIVLDVHPYESNDLEHKNKLINFYTKFGFIKLPNNCMYRNPY